MHYFVTEYLFISRGKNSPVSWQTNEQINLTVHSLRNQFMGRRPNRIRRLAHLPWKLLCLFCPDKLLHLKTSLQNHASYPLSLTTSYMLDLQTLICSLQTLTCLDLRKCPCREWLLYAHIAKKTIRLALWSCSRGAAPADARVLFGCVQIQNNSRRCHTYRK